MKRIWIVVSLAGLLPLLTNLEASQMLPMTAEDRFQSAGAVFRGTVIETRCFKNAADGLIYTRTLVRVNEVFKGKCPQVVKLVHRGGEVDGIGNRDDLSPGFNPGEECVLFVARRSDGTLFAEQGSASVFRMHRDGGGALTPDDVHFLNRLRIGTNSGSAPGLDVTDQSADLAPDGSVAAPSGDSGGSSTNGLLADSSGVPTRFSLPDRGEAIPYLVDASNLPAGITLSQALGAVSNAFAAWAGASSFKFVFAGTNDFGQPSANINTNDGIFRIQLHDAYNFIPAGNILGEGGSYFTVGLLTNAHWGRGGNVAGTEFNQSLCGYVVLKHTNTAMQSLSTFTEVLTHEIGHVIGLAHSSEIVTNDPVLTNSIMYFLAHEDGRGAKLNSYDTNVVREVHPLNTPPYAFDRVLDITDALPQPAVAGINEVQLRSYDLQSTNLTLSWTNATSNYGTFSSTGNLIRFTPNVFGDGARVDPAGNSFYEILYARGSDGTNASPFVKLRVVSFNSDSDSPSDGLPDNWMIANFTHPDPRSNDKSRAGDDADGDRLNNLQECIAGMNPRDGTSAQRITLMSTTQLQWQAKAFELYEIQSVTNLTSTNWTRFGNPVEPTTAAGTFTNPYNPASPRQFFRIMKVP